MTGTVFMVDSIVSPQTANGQPIPQAVMTAPAVAGYLHGNSWPTYAPYAQARPDLVKAGRLVSITLSAAFPARCLDIESGGAVNSQAPAWIRNLADRSQGKPILYTSASNVAALVATMNAAGIARSDYLIWSAHYTLSAHICSPATCGYPQADGTQYTDKIAGNCDGSIMFDYCFQPIAPPVPKPPKPPEDTMSIAVALNKNGRLEAFVHLKDGTVKHTWQTATGGHWQGEDPKDPKKQAQWFPLGNPGV
jgi:hypothetical protein